MRSLLPALLAALLAAAPVSAQAPFWSPASDGLPTGPVATLQTTSDGETAFMGTLGGLYGLSGGAALPLTEIEDTEINAVERAPDGVLYAVSRSDSTLFRSADDGTSWRALPVPGHIGVTRNYHIAPLGGGLVYAFIQGNPGCDTERDGLIWHRSTDGGETWTCLPDDPVLGRARDVVATDDDAVLAVSQTGVYRSTDGGFSWELAMYENEEPFAIDGYHFVGPSGPFVLVVDWGYYTIYRSADGGRTWAATTLEGFAEGLARDDSAGEMPTLFAGLQSGTLTRGGPPPSSTYYPGGVWRSDDGGLTWNDTALGDTSAPALALLEEGAERTLLAGGVSGLFQSTDSGASWTPYQDDLANQWAIDIAFAPDGTGYVSTFPRRLHRIASSSSTAWEPVTLPPFDEQLLDYGNSNRFATPRIWELGVAPDGTLYAVDGNLLRSDDSGETWEAMPVGFILYDLNVLADGSLLAAGNNGAFRSTNRGESWDRVGNELPSGRSIRAVAQAADGTVYGGGTFMLYVLAPGEETWAEVPLEGHSVQDLAVSASGRVWAGTQQRVLTNSGNRAIDAGGVFRSDNEGETWELVGLDSVVVQALTVESDDRLLAGPYASTDGGDTWTYLGESMQSTEVLALAIAADGYAWAATKGGGVYRSSRSAVDAEDDAPQAEANVLEAAYPNPTRGKATFTLRLGQAQDAVVVEAFDVLGRRVALLHDGPLAAGQHDLTLDGGLLPAGVYVVRLEAGRTIVTERVTVLR